MGIGGGLLLVSYEEVRSKEAAAVAAATATTKDDGKAARASIAKRRGAASRSPAVQVRKTGGAKHPFQSPRGTAGATKRRSVQAPKSPQA